MHKVVAGSFQAHRMQMALKGVWNDRNGCTGGS